MNEVFSEMLVKGALLGAYFLLSLLLVQVVDWTSNGSRRKRNVNSKQHKTTVPFKNPLPKRLKTHW